MFWKFIKWESPKRTRSNQPRSALLQLTMYVTHGCNARRSVSLLKWGPRWKQSRLKGCRELMSELRSRIYLHLTSLFVINGAFGQDSCLYYLPITVQIILDYPLSLRNPLVMLIKPYLLYNRATTALMLTFEVCLEMRKHMEILPKTGFIQAQSSFNAQLKFLPR